MTASAQTLLVPSTTGRWARRLALTLGLGVASLHGGTWAAQAAPAAQWDLVGLKASHSYTPSVGESLERIVAKTMPNSPLSVSVLSQAFVLLNPQAFGTAKPQRTQSTATLKVPNHNQLLQMVLAHSPADAAPARAPEPAAPKAPHGVVRYAGGPVSTPSSFDTSSTERRGWVQYPSLNRATTLSTEVSAESAKWVQYPRLARVGPPSALPEPLLDTSGWVRYVANRIYPKQQFAQLFN